MWIFILPKNFTVICKKIVIHIGIKLFFLNMFKLPGHDTKDGHWEKVEMLEIIEMALIS